MTRNNLPSLPAILAIVLVLRCIWILLLPVERISDAAAYEIFARNIAEHGVYGWTPTEPGAYWAVGAAAIYAGAYLLLGFNDWAVLTVNMISSLVAVWCLFDLGRRWFEERVGQIAALLFAIWPLAIQYSTVMASELHFIALSLLGLTAWNRAGLGSAKGWIMIGAAGLCLAAATYVRPIALLIPAALAISHILRAPRQTLAPLLNAVLVTAVIFALVSPWSARNERVFGERVFISTNFWPNFWMGNNPETTGAYQPLPEEAETMGELDRAAFMKDLAVAHLKEAPLGFVTRTISKAVRLHDRETIGVVWNEPGIRNLVGDRGVVVTKAASSLFWYAALLAAVIGIVALIRSQGVWAAMLSPPVWLWAYFTAIHAIIVVGDRYHIPAIPMVALLAAVGLNAIARRSIASKIEG